MNVTVLSDKGKRASNQDVVHVGSMPSGGSLYMVVDGMGGYEHGEKAAKLVAENIQTYLSTVEKIGEKELQKAINKANLAIRQQKKELNEKMGATVGGVILNGNEAQCFWVGDVKIFQFQDKQLHFETTAHTLVNALMSHGSMSDAAQLTKYKHVVMRSVQGDVALSQMDYVDLQQLTTQDLLLICSDGVHEVLDGRQISDILTHSESIAAALLAIERRLQSDAGDNFSLIAIDFMG